MASYNNAHQQSERKVFKSSAVIVPQSTSTGFQDQSFQNYQNMATMAMQQQHQQYNPNAPPAVPSKPAGGQMNVQYSTQSSPQYSSQLSQGANQQQFTSSQNFNQHYGTQQAQCNQQFSSQVQLNQQQPAAGGISVQSNRTGQPQYQQQSFNQQQQAHQHTQQQQNYQNQQQQQYTQQYSQQQQLSQNQQQQSSQQINVQQQHQYNQVQQQQNQQQLRGQQIHPQPAGQRGQQTQQFEQRQDFNSQQQHQYSNGGGQRPPTGQGAPSFLQKKHFVANQTNVEWKNLSMRKVERSNSQNFQSNQVDSDEDGHLPEFTSMLHDLNDLREGERAHFDCCLAPQLVGDSSMKVTWTKDGQAIQANSRFIIQESFGRLSLDIIGVRPEDQGNYQVYVSNNQGDAASQATLRVQPVAKAFTPTGPGQSDEGSARFIPEMIREERSTEHPQFTERLPETLVIEEGEPLRLQASLQPANDPLMKVNWTFNGRPLLMGSRMAIFYDFGLVTLSILDVRAEDSGSYVCTARNSLGQAETRTQLTCQTKGKSTVKPMFQEPLVVTPGGDLNEGDYVHLETRIEPRNDAYVIIEWYHNDRLIQTGQRLRPHYDFGIVTLDIVGAYAEDSGTFTVRATNSLGSDTTSVTLRVAGKPGLLLDSQHPEGLAKIAELEYKDFSREFTYNDYSKHEPRFSEQLPRLPDFNEGEKLRLEAQVEPRGDPNMKVEWFLNGRPINNGHRTRTVFDFGFASLDVLDVQTRDAGEYVIRATNTLGTAESKTFLKVIGRGGVISDAQYAASLDKIRDLESYENGPSYIPDTIQDELPASAPMFTEQLQPVPELREGQSIHLECTVSPPNDPTLKVEWFVNGRPLHTGSRFRVFNDFGAIGLDILGVIPEDSGEYVVKVSNALGSNTSSTYLQVKARAAIILEPQAPGGAEKVRELEDMLNYKPQAYDEDVTHQAPIFVRQLQGPQGKVKEGQSIHLECQVQPINDPSLKIEWFFNGRPLATGSRCRFTHDLEYVALDMLYVFPRDSGDYSVKVTNSAGSVVSSTKVHCFEKKNVVTESLNPRALKKIQDLEAWNL